jgi:hypothetical protein
MRLWYQSLTRADAWPAYSAALRRMLAAAADPGTEFEVHGITRRGGIGDQYRSLEFIETIEVLENVAQADASGFDAILLGNIGFPRASRRSSGCGSSAWWTSTPPSRKGRCASASSASSSPPPPPASPGARRW